ncbi:MAG: hypothetical protein CMP59_09155 [Flavobacteriales bacterium]|nr:hypothetical protein [Flavobacteriales bacterium]|tara:strand:+ start:1326 stop:1787 length:462 start_codon:yes stop_codon:yes gene_type:complete
MTIESTKDFKLLASLNEEVQDWHHKHYPEVFKQFDQTAIEDAFKVLIKKENTFAFVAEENAHAVGYLLAFIEHRTESAFQYERKILNIDQILVLEQLRKSGIGQALMDRAILLAKEKGVDEIQLEPWEENQLALEFFAKNGFEYFKHKMTKSV